MLNNNYSFSNDRRVPSEDPQVPAQGPLGQPPSGGAGGTASPFRNPLFLKGLPTTYEYGHPEDDLAVGHFDTSQTPPSRVANRFNEGTATHPIDQVRRLSVATVGNGLMIRSLPYGPPGAPSGGSAYGLSGRTPYGTPGRSALASYGGAPMSTPVATRITSKSQLRPKTNANPKYRRASLLSVHVSPMVGVTLALHATYKMCHPNAFTYNFQKNPRRVLTKPSEGKFNNGCDNTDSDYILYVNDVLGSQEGKKYLVLDILGSGTFGQVVKCQNLHNQELVAVKIIKSKPAYLNQSLTEVSILEIINNKIDPHNTHNFLRLKDKFIHKNHLCIVFESLGCNLYELLKQNQFHGLSYKICSTFTKQMLDSLVCLKNYKIIHCDLKPENILLCVPNKPLIKIIDFGSACFEHQTVYTYLQSRFYRSPEIILGLPYNASIDMWSLGCIVAELYLGMPLFPGTSEYNQLSRIIKMFGMPPAYMLEMGKNSWNFIDKIPTEDGYTYRLKSMEQYAAENDAPEKPSKNYFHHDLLEDIVLNYNIHPSKETISLLSSKDLTERKTLVHFLHSCLNLNPLERFTPQQAVQHPFVKGAVQALPDWSDNSSTSGSSYAGSRNGRGTRGSVSGASLSSFYQ